MSFKKDLPLILDMIRLSKQCQYSSVMSVRSSAGGYLAAHQFFKDLMSWEGGIMVILTYNKSGGYLAAHQFFQDLMSGEGGIMVILTYNKSSQYTNELRISTCTM